MMTDEEIREILTRMADSKERWNVLLAQADRAKLVAEVERLRKRLSTCKFCGQEVAEGAGGHTSRCYERALAERKVVESTPHGKDAKAAPMSEALLAHDLAKRAVASPHWRWLPGMRCTHRWTGGIRVLADESGEQSEAYIVLPDADGNAVMTIYECGIMGGFPDAGSAYPFLPDLNDPATLGCLLALVREARGDSGIHARMMDDNIWGVYAWGKRRPIAVAGTEAEALVKALEAAP